MEIKRTIDIEDAIRLILKDHITCYCRPLPANLQTPSILVQQVGGSGRDDWGGSDVIDTLDVVLDARAESDMAAWETLRNAIGILKATAETQETVLCRVTVNTQGAWGIDPVRPDLKLCSARLQCTVRPETVTI